MISDDNPSGGPEYLVKVRFEWFATFQSLTRLLVLQWKGLSYDSVTWEIPEDIEDFQVDIDEFLAREQRQACRPRCATRTTYFLSPPSLIFL